MKTVMMRLLLCQYFCIRGRGEEENLKAVMREDHINDDDDCSLWSNECPCCQRGSSRRPLSGRRWDFFCKRFETEILNYLGLVLIAFATCRERSAANLRCRKRGLLRKRDRMIKLCFPTGVDAIALIMLRVG